MIDRSCHSLALGVLCAAFLSTSASAEPPADKPGAPNAPERGEVRPGAEKGARRSGEPMPGEKRGAPPGHADIGEKRGVPGGHPDHGEHGGPGHGHGDKGAAHGAHEGPSERAERADAPRWFRTGWGSLREDARKEKLTKAQLEERLAKLRETREERRAAHRDASKRRWGGTLAKPAAREELGHHERRMAFLNRALLLAETEPKLAKDKEKLVERIEKLIAKENARHEKAMARFASEAPAAAAQAPASAGTANTQAAGDVKGAVK